MELRASHSPLSAPSPSPEDAFDSEPAFRARLSLLQYQGTCQSAQCLPSARGAAETGGEGMGLLSPVVFWLFVVLAGGDKVRAGLV